MNDDSKGRTGDNNQFFNEIWRFRLNIVTLHLENRKEEDNGVKF